MTNKSTQFERVARHGDFRKWFFLSCRVNRLQPTKFLYEKMIEAAQGRNLMTAKRAEFLRKSF